MAVIVTGVMQWRHIASVDRSCRMKIHFNRCLHVAIRCAFFSETPLPTVNSQIERKTKAPFPRQLNFHVKRLLLVDTVSRDYFMSNVSDAANRSLPIETAITAIMSTYCDSQPWRHRWTSNDGDVIHAGGPDRRSADNYQLHFVDRLWYVLQQLINYAKIYGHMSFVRHARVRCVKRKC